MFYLGLESSELEELLQGLGENDSVKIHKIFKKLIESFTTQQAELKVTAIAIPLRVRFNSFGQLLSTITKTQQYKAPIQAEIQNIQLERRQRIQVVVAQVLGHKPA